MSAFGDKWMPIYINGVKRMATIGQCWENSFDGIFYADTDDLPLRRCSCRSAARLKWSRDIRFVYQETLIL